CPIGACAVAAPDTGASDTGASDTGAPDTGAPDTGAPDTGAPDTNARCPRHQSDNRRARADGCPIRCISDTRLHTRLGAGRTRVRSGAYTAPFRTTIRETGTVVRLVPARSRMHAQRKRTPTAA